MEAEFVFDVAGLDSVSDHGKISCHMIFTMAAANGVMLFLLTLCSGLLPSAAQYKPTWESLDSRPLPAWSVSLAPLALGDVRCMSIFLLLLFHFFYTMGVGMGTC